MRAITIFLLLLVSISSFSQIEVREKTDNIETNPFKEIEKNIKNKPYDSLSNSPNRNLGGFMGQRLLMNKKNTGTYYSEFEKRTYSGFFTDIHSEPQKIYKGLSSTEKAGKISTDINEVYGKYFKYVGYEFTEVNSRYSQKFNVYLKLEDEDGNNLYYEYLKNVSAYFISSKYSFPFITEGYYKKSINNTKGKMVKKDGSFYTCTDVFVEENSNSLTYTLQDRDGNIENYSSARIRSFQQYNFEYDSSYLSKDKSTFNGILRDKSTGSISVFNSGDEIILAFFSSPSTCFSKDDDIQLTFSDDNKYSQYNSGKFNCKGYAYISIDISINRHSELIKKLVENDLRNVMIVGTTTDYILLPPESYTHIKESIKAHYMNILNN